VSVVTKEKMAVSGHKLFLGGIPPQLSEYVLRVCTIGGGGDSVA
jgi:hypothetical protein